VTQHTSQHLWEQCTGWLLTADEQLLHECYMFSFAVVAHGQVTLPASRA
jgi:hypothetical protein